MHKRTLYITEDSYQKVDTLSKNLNTSHAEILRRAVEEGLKKLDPPTNPAPPPDSLLRPVIVSQEVSQGEENKLVSAIRSLFK